MKKRFEKDKEERKKLTKTKGEVFTPSWVCNLQNNLVDEAWFGYKNVFNTPNEKTWETNKNKIMFPKDKGWKDYVSNRVLEITCGEAPYLVSRYDTVTGEAIQLEDRIGLLDRKIRVINENTSDKETWFYYVRKAYQSTYGFDISEDNVKISRNNLVDSFKDYYCFKFNEEPKPQLKDIIEEIVNINIWCMDGLKFIHPVTGEYSTVKDWETGEVVEFRELMKK